MFTKRLWISVALAILHLLSDVSGADLPRQRAPIFHGITPGPALYSAAVSGNRVFVCSRTDLQSYDITTPDHPRPLASARIGVIFADAGKILMDGNRLWLGQFANGLKLFDISDPARIQPLAAMAGSASDLSVKGNFAFASTEDGKLCVYEYTGGALVKLSEFALGLRAGEHAPSVVSQNSLFLGGSPDGQLQYFDISDPRQMKPPVKVSVGGVMLPAGYPSIAPWGLGISQGRLVVSCLRQDGPVSSSLRIFDIAADPLNPRLLGEAYDLAEGGIFLGIQNNYAFLAHTPSSGESIEVIDLSDPSMLTTAAMIAARSLPPSAPPLLSTVGLSDSYVFVPTGGGLEVYDISAAANPRLLRPKAQAGLPFPAFISGNHAFVADATTEAKIFDISDALNPILAATVPFRTNAAQFLAISDNRLFTVTTNGVDCFDVTDRSHPVRIGSYTGGFPFGMGAYPESLSAIGNVAIVSMSQKDNCYYSSDWGTTFCDWSRRVQAINFELPAAPAIGGHTQFPLGNAGRLYCYKNAGYIGGQNIFQIIDLSDPANPQLGQTLPNPRWTSWMRMPSMSFSGDLAFVSNGTNGVEILDVSNALAPVAISRIETTGDVYDTAMIGRYAYVADRTFGMRVYDLSTVTSPRLVGGNPLTGARGVMATVDAMFVDTPHGSALLDIFRPTIAEARLQLLSQFDNRFRFRVVGPSDLVGRLLQSPDAESWTSQALTITNGLVDFANINSGVNRFFRFVSP